MYSLALFLLIPPLRFCVLIASSNEISYKMSPILSLAIRLFGFSTLVFPQLKTANAQHIIITILFIFLLLSVKKQTFSNTDVFYFEILVNQFTIYKGMRNSRFKVIAFKRRPSAFGQNIFFLHIPRRSRIYNCQISVISCSDESAFFYFEDLSRVMAHLFDYLFNRNFSLMIGFKHSDNGMLN